MIASLRGEVLTIGLDHAVIECAGVGYKVLATPPTLGTLRRGEEARVLTHMAVKEDAITLFGFTDTDDRDMFLQLQSVSGLGPKLALAALSVMGSRELADAIAGSEGKRLQKIPGVGKRMADRLVVELKDKVAAFTTPADASPGDAATSGTAAQGHTAAAGPVNDQVVEALVGLGFPEKQASAAVTAVMAEQPDADTSTLLRAALSQIGNRK